MPPNTSIGDYCGMLRNLLAERFHFAFHWVKQPRVAYELTVLPGGPKFGRFAPDPEGKTELSLGDSDKSGYPLLPAGRATAVLVNNKPNGDVFVSFRNTLAELTRSLGWDITRANGSRDARNPHYSRVIDKTGLTGVFDFRYSFRAPMLANDPESPGASVPTETGSIFDSIQKLGLKLTKTNDALVDVMIVDHVDRTPTEN